MARSQRAGGAPKPCQGSVPGCRAGKAPARLPGRFGERRFAGRIPSAQPLVLTSPTEGWEGASSWLPTISPLPWLQQHKRLQMTTKRVAGECCVCVCALGTPCHLVTCHLVTAPWSIWGQECACAAKEGLGVGVSLSHQSPLGIPGSLSRKRVPVTRHFQDCQPHWRPLTLQVMGSPGGRCGSQE